MNIRMIATDIDNTIIPKNGALPERVKAALSECERRGILTVLASGRTFYGARSVSVEAGLSSPVVSANGGRADASPEGGVVFEDTLSPYLSARVCERLMRAGCFMTSYVGTFVYALAETNGFGSRGQLRSEASSAQRHIIAGDKARFLSEGTQRPYKYEAYSDDTKLIDELRHEFTCMGLSVSSAFEYNLEIMAPGGGKGRAIEALARKYSIPRECIMAFGDGTNDIGMLNYAGWPVAVGNAVAPLKRAARIVCADCDSGGVADVLEECVIGGKWA